MIKHYTITTAFTEISEETTLHFFFVYFQGLWGQLAAASVCCFQHSLKGDDWILNPWQLKPTKTVSFPRTVSSHRDSGIYWTTPASYCNSHLYYCCTEFCSFYTLVILCLRLLYIDLRHTRGKFLLCLYAPYPPKLILHLLIQLKMLSVARRMSYISGWNLYNPAAISC